MVYSHFSVSLVCQKQAVHPGLVDVQALLGQKTTSQPTREFKTANRQWHFNLKYRYPNHRARFSKDPETFRACREILKSKPVK